MPYCRPEDGSRSTGKVGETWACGRDTGDRCERAGDGYRLLCGHHGCAPRRSDGVEAALRGGGGGSFSGMTARLNGGVARVWCFIE